MSMNRFFKILAMLVVMASIPFTSFAAAKITNFDLFGVKPNALDTELNKFGVSVEQTISKRLNDPKLAKLEFADNRSICFKAHGKVYEMTRKDSETEGFTFFITRNPEKMDSCAGPYLLPTKYKKVFSEKELTPLSSSYPDIELGVTGPATIQKHFGNPTFQTKGKLIYVLERDRRKEKDCHQDPKKGEFQSINVTFFFDKQSKLDGIYLNNCIMGQCGCWSS